MHRLRARLRESTTTEVAVKTLKGRVCLICIVQTINILIHTAGDFDQLEVDQFIEENLKVSRFKHSHVMGLIGVCLDAGSAPLIISPFMANGSLLQYLPRQRENIVLSNDYDSEEEVRLVCACVRQYY